MPKTSLVRLALLLSGLLVPAAQAAVEQSCGPAAESPWSFSTATAAAHVYRADLDGGGETRVTSYHLRAGASRPVGRGTVAGVNLIFDTYDRDLSGTQGFAGLDPWSRRSRLGFTGLLRAGIRQGWSYGVRPFIGWSSEDGGIDSNAMSYGAAVAVVAGVSADRRIGLGVRLSRKIDDSVKAAPVIILDWEINDEWKLSNPDETNFTVPAGLELIYKPGPKWRFGLAGIYQASEFRLDDRGFAPGGIGESNAILSFLRISRRLPADWSIHAYFGAVFDGELRVEDADGRRLASGDYDTAPLAALSLEGSF